MESKTCKTCNLTKSTDDFYKHKGSCKPCINLKNKKWRDENKDTMKSLGKAWYEKTKVARRKHKSEYMKNRRKTDNLFALRSGLSRLIRMSMLREGYSKNSKTQDILGCTFEEFKSHIESQFENWMNWDNKGLYNGDPDYGWDIDHVICLSSAVTEEDIIRLNHYTNLQPLCSYINRHIKRDN